MAKVKKTVDEFWSPPLFGWLYLLKRTEGRDFPTYTYTSKDLIIELEEVEGLSISDKYNLYVTVGNSGYVGYGLILKETFRDCEDEVTITLRHYLKRLVTLFQDLN